MPDISAQQVKSLRDRTQLPMMECKKALIACEGDEEKAIDWLRKQGKKTMDGRSDRATAEGYLASYGNVSAGRGALVELLCESPPVAGNAEFRQLANDLAQQLATGPGATTAEELLAQPSPSQAGKTLKDQLDELSNKIREVFRVARMLRVESGCGAYTHFTGTDGVLVEVDGSDQQTANEIAMHIAAMKPLVVTREHLDAADIHREKELQSEMARKEGKPESIIEKMIEGRMRNWYVERVLLDQPFVKDESGKTTVEQAAKKAGLKLKRLTHWKLGKS